jgi:hypothetical protein
VIEDAEAASPTGALVRFEVDGAAYEASVDIGRPESDLDHQEQRLRAKFARLAGPVLGVEAAKTVADDLLDVTAVGSVAELFA